MGGEREKSPKRAIEWPKWRDIARMIIATPISSTTPLRGRRAREGEMGGEQPLIRSNLRHKDEEPGEGFGWAAACLPAAYQVPAPRDNP